MRVFAATLASAVALSVVSAQPRVVPDEKVNPSDPVVDLLLADTADGSSYAACKQPDPLIYLANCMDAASYAAIDTWFKSGIVPLLKTYKNDVLTSVDTYSYAQELSGGVCPVWAQFVTDNGVTTKSSSYPRIFIQKRTGSLRNFLTAMYVDSASNDIELVDWVPTSKSMVDLLQKVDKQCIVDFLYCGNYGTPTTYFDSSNKLQCWCCTAGSRCDCKGDLVMNSEKKCVCRPGYELVGGRDSNKCIKSCPSGYHAEGDKCVYTCDSNHHVNDDNNGCIKNCDPGYHPEGETCVFNCDSNHHPNDANNGCIKNCDPGYHPEGESCVYTCDADHHVNDDNNGCIKNCDPGYHPEGETCVFNCDSNHHVNDANDGCIKNCDTGYHPEGETCVFNCDADHHVNDDNNGCIKNCGADYHPEGETCVYTCDADHHVNDDNNGCIKNCDPEFHPVGETCVYTCDSDHHVNDDNDGCIKNCGPDYHPEGETCVYTCDADHHVNDDNNGCIKNCDPEYHPVGETCVYTCDADHHVNDDNDGCIKNCGPDYHPVGETCVYTCDSDHHVNDDNNGCIKNCADGWHAQGEKCVKNCDSNHHLNENGDGCIKNCDEGYHADGETCVYTCDEDHHVNDDNNGCIKNCGPDYHPEGETCVYTCDADHHVNDDNNGCIKNCDPEYHPVGETCVYTCDTDHHVNDDNNGCIKNCGPDYHPEGETCVYTCDADHHVNDDNNGCIKNCDPEYHPEGETCVYTCDADHHVNDDNNGCIKNCGSDYHPEGETCVYTCDADHHVNDDNNGCIKNCDPDYHPEGETCVYTCDADHHVNDDNNGCIKNCDPEYHPEGETCVYTCDADHHVNDNNDGCIKNCDTGYHPEGETCVYTCDADHHVNDDNNGCIKNCDADYHPEGETCVYTCDADHHVNDDNNGCIKNCDPEYHPVGETCVYTCDADHHVNDDNDGCIKNCADGWHAQGEKCVKNCDSDHHLNENGDECIKNCGTDYHPEGETCVFTCDEDHHVNDANDGCIKNCDEGFHPEGETCVFNCDADHHVNADNNGCIKNCDADHFPVGETCVKLCPPDHHAEGETCVKNCPPGHHAEGEKCYKDCFWTADRAGYKCYWTDETKSVYKLWEQCQVHAPVPKDNYVHDLRVNKNDQSGEDPAITISSQKKGALLPTSHKATWKDYALYPTTLEDEVVFGSFGVYDLTLTAWDYREYAKCLGCIAVIDQYRPTSQCLVSADPVDVEYTTASLQAAKDAEDAFTAFYDESNIKNNGAFDEATKSNQRCDDGSAAWTDFFKDPDTLSLSDRCFSDSLITDLLHNAPAEKPWTLPYEDLQCQRCCSKSKHLKEYYYEFDCAVDPEVTLTDPKVGAGSSCSFDYCVTVSADTLATATLQLTEDTITHTAEVIAGLPQELLLSMDSQPATLEIHESITCKTFAGGCSYTPKLKDLFVHNSNWGSQVAGVVSSSASDYVHWRYSLDTNSWFDWDDDAELSFTVESTDLYVEAWTHCGRVLLQQVRVVLHPHTSHDACATFNAMWAEDAQNPLTSEAYTCAYPNSDFVLMTFQYDSFSGLTHLPSTVQGKYTDVKCYVTLAESSHLTEASETEFELDIASLTNAEGRIQISQQLALELVRDPTTALDTDVNVRCDFTYTHFGGKSSENEPCSRTFTITDCTGPEVEASGTEAVCSAGECLDPVNDGAHKPGPNEPCGGVVFGAAGLSTVVRSFSGECCDACDKPLTCTSLTQFSSDGVKRCEVGPPVPIMVALASMDLAALAAHRDTLYSMGVTLLGVSGLVAVVALVVVRRRRATSEARVKMEDDAYYALLE